MIIFTVANHQKSPSEELIVSWPVHRVTFLKRWSSRCFFECFQVMMFLRYFFVCFFLCFLHPSSSFFFLESAFQNRGAYYTRVNMVNRSFRMCVHVSIFLVHITSLWITFINYNVVSLNNLHLHWGYWWPLYHDQHVIWIEEMILTLAGQSQWLSHVCTWKSFQVSSTGCEPMTYAMLVQYP